MDEGSLDARHDLFYDHAWTAIHVPFMMHLVAMLVSKIRKVQ